MRYSERLLIDETGGLPELEQDAIPQTLRNALINVVNDAVNREQVGVKFERALDRAGIEHFGWRHDTSWHYGLSSLALPEFLDFMEILVEEAEADRAYSLGYAMADRYAPAYGKFADKFNDLADRHRFGYRIVDGDVQRIGSPALAATIVSPALLAGRRPDWDQVERSYREALQHQRGGPDENDDALTAASAALESALKAAGMSGKTLRQLAADFKKSSLAAPQLSRVPEMLDQLLQRTGAVRNIHGDAHGREPGDHPDVPQELVDLAIHLVGSFIVYLERVSRP
jgi:hypothetical protein